MAFIDEQLIKFKRLFESSIMYDGAKGKESIIRSSQPISLIHDAVKYELIMHGVAEDQIFPRLWETKPEIKLTGFLKKKDQDICVIPRNVAKQSQIIDWGPMAFQRKIDPYGFEYSEKTLVINIRSQMSSLAKNADTLLERTFAEAQNLHMRYPNMVLGEVYLIPIHEYDNKAVENKTVAFKLHQTDVEKYISFFDSINRRQIGSFDYMYERCALLVVDFSKDNPMLFRNSDELKVAGVISQQFQIEYSTLGFDNFVEDILSAYSARFDIRNLLQ